MFLTKGSPLEEAACSMWSATEETRETVKAWLVDRRWGREGWTSGARGVRAVEVLCVPLQRWIHDVRLSGLLARASPPTRDVGKLFGGEGGSSPLAAQFL